MLGPTHRRVGFLAGAAAAAYAGQPLLIVVGSGVVASASAHGGMSPDVDQTDLWVRARQTLRPMLGRRYDKLLNHRYLSHWWGLPAMAWPLALGMPVEFRWAAMMLVVGWASHLVGDFVFGEGPAAGVPVLPWGIHLGLHLDTGGFWETGRIKVAGRRFALPFAPASGVITVGIVAVFWMAGT